MTETCFTFQIDDFIKIYTGSIARLGVLFIHQLASGSRRLFAKVVEVDGVESQGLGLRDSILDLPLLRLEGVESVIGMPAIKAEKLYIVPLAPLNSEAETQLIYCN